MSQNVTTLEENNTKALAHVGDRNSFVREELKREWDRKRECVFIREKERITKNKERAFAWEREIYR